MDKIKLKALVLGLICASSLTTAVIKLNNQTNVSADDANIVAEAIDNTDLTNEAEVAKLAGTMNDWGEYVGGEFQSAHLERVVDGDTIVVDIEGEQYSVRLIGVNTPESVASAEYLKKSGKENNAEGKAASDYTKAVLSDTDVVYLQADVSDTDRYDRLLRYVWVEVPDDMNDTREIETKMLNAMLVADDMAAVEIYPLLLWAFNIRVACRSGSSTSCRRLDCDCNKFRLVERFDATATSSVLSPRRQVCRPAL